MRSALHRLRRDDAGQGMAPLMVLVGLSLLVVTFSLLVPWGSAATEKTVAQTGADAAALAAAQQRRQAVVDVTAPGLDLATGLVRVRVAAGLGAPCGQARAYAARNDSTVTSCSAARRGQRTGATVEVRKQGTAFPETGEAEARATAVSDVDVDACFFDVVVPPLTAANGGPSHFRGRLVCGDLEIGYRFVNLPPYVSDEFLPGSSEVRIYRDLEPRLVD